MKVRNLKSILMVLIVASMASCTISSDPDAITYKLTEDDNSKIPSYSNTSAIRFSSSKGSVVCTVEKDKSVQTSGSMWDFRRFNIPRVHFHIQYYFELESIALSARLARVEEDVEYFSEHTVFYLTFARLPKVDNNRIVDNESEFVPKCYFLFWNESPDVLQLNTPDLESITLEFDNGSVYHNVIVIRSENTNVAEDPYYGIEANVFYYSNEFGILGWDEPDGTQWRLGI